jgi:hypothetical protein
MDNRDWNITKQNWTAVVKKTGWIQDNGYIILINFCDSRPAIDQKTGDRLG